MTCAPSWSFSKSDRSLSVAVGGHFAPVPFLIQTGYLKAVWPEFCGVTKRLWQWSAGMIVGATGTCKPAAQTPSKLNHGTTDFCKEDHNLHVSGPTGIH